MPNQKTIQNGSLIPGQMAYVHGTVGYSHIASLIEGEELKTYNANRKQYNPKAIENVKPFTRIVLNNVEMRYLDKNNPSILERYIEERFFVSQNHPENGLECASESKSPSLPTVAVRLANGEYQQVELKGELAKGQGVTLLIRCFGTKFAGRVGVGLNGVLIDQEPIRYRGADHLEDALKQAGIIFHPLTVDSPEVQSTIEEDEMPDVVPAAAAPAPAPMPAPLPVQNQNPYRQPMPASAWQQPVQPQQPAPKPYNVGVPASAYAQQPTQQQPYQAPAPQAPAPAPQNPYGTIYPGQVQPQQNGGIVFDPNNAV